MPQSKSFDPMGLKNPKDMYAMGRFDVMGHRDNYGLMPKDMHVPYKDNEHSIYKAGMDSIIGAKAQSAISEQQMFRAKYLQ